MLAAIVALVKLKSVADAPFQVTRDTQAQPVLVAASGALMSSSPLRPSGTTVSSRFLCG